MILFTGNHHAHSAAAGVCCLLAALPGGHSLLRAQTSTE